jgi:hypothetical protein
MLKNYHIINLLLVAIIIAGIASRYAYPEIGNNLFLLGTLTGYFYKTWVITKQQAQLPALTDTSEISFMMRNQTWVNLIFVAIIIGGAIVRLQGDLSGQMIYNMGLFLSFFYKSWIIEQYQKRIDYFQKK